MRSHQRIFIFLLLVLALTSVVSPWLAAFWGSIIETRPEWDEYRQPFSRIFDRFFMISGVILFFACRRLLRISSIAELGLRSQGRGIRDLASGFFVALASMVVLAFAMSMTDVFTPYFRLSLAVSLERCAKALLTAATVGFLEEIFFRGIIFKGLCEEGKVIRAFGLAGLFYSAIHFVKPGEEYFVTGIEPWIGFRHLISTFEPFLDLPSLLPGLTGLFVIGLVLSYAFLRTGSLYLSIGLHAGWIFSIKTIRVFGNYTREDLGWMFGSTDPKIVSGVAAWIGIAMVGVFVHWITRRRSPLFGDQPPRAKV